MFIFKNVLIIIALTAILTGCAALQTSNSDRNNVDPFRSDDGFKIDLPKSVSSVKDATFYYANVDGRGKSYIWENTQNYTYMVSVYNLDNGKTALTDKEKKAVLEEYKAYTFAPLKSNNIPLTEKKYIFNGNEGVEIQATNSKGNSKMVARMFSVNKRFYYVGDFGKLYWLISAA